MGGYSSAHLTGGASRWLRIAMLAFAVFDSASAQNRGVYPLGMMAINSGGTPAPGLSYSNLFKLNSRNESRGADGEVLATGSNSTLLDLNTFYWAIKRPVLGGARHSGLCAAHLRSNRVLILCVRD